MTEGKSSNVFSIASPSNIASYPNTSTNINPLKKKRPEEIPFLSCVVTSAVVNNNNIGIQLNGGPSTSSSSTTTTIRSEESDRPSHVSLLGGKYLLFSNPAPNSVSPSGVRCFQKCINVETRDQFTCKGVPRNASGVALLAAYHHMEEAGDYIMKAHEVVLSPKSFYLIMPSSHGNVHSYLIGKKQLTEVEAATIFKQMVLSVQCCHEKGIVLRDLKMGKFVFADTERTTVKLESLEDSVMLPDHCDDRLNDKHGCPNYVSPEKADTLRSSKSYPGKATDMWALGVMMYTMLVGRYPFNDNDNSKLFAKIRKGDFTIPNHVSDSAKNLIRNLLNKNPSERFDCSKILKHHWIVNQEVHYNSKNSFDRHDPFHYERESTRDTCYDQIVPEVKV